METLENIIAAHPFWHGLSPQYLPIAAQSGTLERFGVRDLIFQERHDADHLYLLHHGQVALETFVPGSGIITLQILTAGEALGWSWLFPPYQWQYTARSIDATEIVSFSAAILRARAEENPAFGRELVTRMAHVLLHRLQATRCKLQEFHDIERATGLNECLADGEEEPNLNAHTIGR